MTSGGAAPRGSHGTPGGEVQKPRIAVVGGGISGLAAAHRLVELSQQRSRPIDLHLLEASARLGGSIRTERCDGFLIENGPDSFLTEKPAALRLCERLSAVDRLIGTQEQFRRTYILYGGRLHPLPDGFLLLAPTRFWPLVGSSLFSWPGKLRMALDLVLPRGPQDDQSLAHFVRRRLGRQALDRVAQPLIGGIYTADPEQLSLAATMPRFLEMERRQRSVILAMWRQRKTTDSSNGATSGARWSLFASFGDGMQTLVDLLAARLSEGSEGSVHLSCAARSLQRLPAGQWNLNGTTFDALILATPAHLSAGIVRKTDPRLATELDEIPYASSATVTLAFRREDIPHPLDGFGFVVPAVERANLIACTFSSIKYAGRAPAEFVLLRGFVGGSLQPRLLDQDDPALIATVQKDLRGVLGICAAPVLTRVARHNAAMPQYRVGHLNLVQRVEARLANLPGLHLAGGAYHGVGIPDCILDGETAADRVMDSLGPAHTACA